MPKKKAGGKKKDAAAAADEAAPAGFEVLATLKGAQLVSVSGVGVFWGGGAGGSLTLLWLVVNAVG